MAGWLGRARGPSGGREERADGSPYPAALLSWRWGRKLDLVLAEVLADGGEADRVLAASFFHSLAVMESEAGRIGKAKQAIRAAVDAWPSVKVALIEDERLMELVV